MYRVLIAFIMTSILSVCTTAAQMSVPAMAVGGDSTSPSALGCDDPRVEYDLKRRKKKLSDIGVLKVYERQTEGPNRWCIIVKSGSKTLGKNKTMSVKLAWHKPGQKIVWPTTEGATFDAGIYRNYAGSAYSTGRAGMCLAIRGYIVWRGKTYSRTVRNVYCY